MQWYIILLLIVVVLLVGYGGYKGYQYFFPAKSLSTTEPFISEVVPTDPPKNAVLSTTKKKESSKGDYTNMEMHPYFEIQIGDEMAGKVQFQLFDSDVPKTCMNFRYLCSQSVLNQAKPDYEGTLFHRIIPDFMIQGGDTTNGDGTGGMSIYGRTFEDEHFHLKHNQPGLLSMANSGPNTNGSQFFITTNKTPWLDGKHVVFGIVISGYPIIERIEKVERDENDTPRVPVKILKCGFESLSSN